MLQVLSNYIWRKRWLKMIREYRSAPLTKVEELQLANLAGDENFKLFLELLELTFSDFMCKYSNIDILNDEKRNQAVRLQGQALGVQYVLNLAKSLKVQPSDEKE